MSRFRQFLFFGTGLELCMTINNNIYKMKDSTNLLLIATLIIMGISASILLFKWLFKKDSIE